MMNQELPEIVTYCTKPVTFGVLSSPVLLSVALLKQFLIQPDKKKKSANYQANLST